MECGCGHVPGQNTILSWKDDSPHPISRLALSADGPDDSCNIPAQYIASPSSPGALPLNPTFTPTNAALQTSGSVVFLYESSETSTICLYALNNPDAQCAQFAYSITIVVGTLPTVSLSKNGAVVQVATLTCPPNGEVFNYYWASFANGPIQFGCGGTAGANTVISYPDSSPVPVRSLAADTESDKSTMICPSRYLPNGGQNSQD
jgi:hypothetical protein